MADRYKTLKDINYPGCFVESGTIGLISETGSYYSFSGKGTDYCVDAYSIYKALDWFQKIEEKVYTEDDMKYAYEGGMTYGMLACRGPIAPTFNFNIWLKNYLQSLNNK